ncbi:MAG: L,D-transpeptidase family protein [Desulfococcaceae bacterium]
MKNIGWSPLWIGLVLGITAAAVSASVADPLGEAAGKVAVEAAGAELPDVFVPYSPDGTDYILLVEKASQTLWVYAYEDRPREVARFSCSTGKQAGRKMVSGDAKTPEGVYFFTKVHEDAELSPIYGIRAFPTDYPNLMDRIAGRTGSAIWLHGTDKPLKDRDSNGCVAMENGDLDRLSEYISIRRTPLIIVDRIQTASFEANRPLGELARARLTAWADALSGGTYHDYVGFYHPDYVPDISWWSRWDAMRDEGLRAEIRNPMVFRHDGRLVVLFDLQLIREDRRVRAGAKQLFFSARGETLSIVGENFQEPGHEPGDLEEHPVLLAAGRLEIVPEPTPEEPAREPAAPARATATLSDAEIQAVVDGWLTAWSAMDIDRYGDYYARDFRARGMDREGWIQYKDQLNRKYEFIRVTSKNLKARPEGNDRAQVSFVQRYESDRYEGVGIKRLILKREGGEWKIFRETFQKM